MRRIIALTALPYLISCAADAREATWSEVDSAGVRVVTSELPGQPWTLSEPEVNLGSVDQGGPTSFFHVTSVRFMSHDRFVVANGGTSQLRFFTNGGEFLGAVGREGRGPEEFRGIGWLAPVGVDSLLVYDEGNDRISVRDTDGGYSRTFRFETPSGAVVPLGVFSDGTILTKTVKRLGEVDGAGTLLDNVLMSRFGRDGSRVDSVGYFPHATRVMHHDGRINIVVSLPVDAPAAFTVAASGFCYSFGQEFQVRCFRETGTLISIARVSRDPRELGDNEGGAYFQREVDSATEAGNDFRADAFKRARPSMVFPDFLPAYADLKTDDRGRVWAKVFPVLGSSTVEWDVFEGARLAGSVEVDPAFQIMDISGDQVIGVFTDELGVEYVRICGIVTL